MYDLDIYCFSCGLPHECCTCYLELQEDHNPECPVCHQLICMCDGFDLDDEFEIPNDCPVCGGLWCICDELASREFENLSMEYLEDIDLAEDEDFMPSHGSGGIEKISRTIKFGKRKYETNNKHQDKKKRQDKKQ